MMPGAVVVDLLLLVRVWCFVVSNYWIEAFAFAPSRSLPRCVDVSVAEFHEKFATLAEGKHADRRVSVAVTVEDIKQTSSRLVFLRTLGCGDGDSNDGTGVAVTGVAPVVELLLRERDGFLTCKEIDAIFKAASQEGAILQCTGFPEKLGVFDGPSFFPQSEPLPSQPVCLHVVAANVTLPTGELFQIRPFETQTPQPDTTPKFKSKAPGRMPPLYGSNSNSSDTSSIQRGSRGGGANRDRGGIFAAWAMETFHLEPGNSDILDIAGGSGQLAFQLGVRRGFNVTVVDPRELRLASDQQRTLRYHRKAGLRLLPGEPNPSLPRSDYGHHFCEIATTSTRSKSQSSPTPNLNPNASDRTFLVSGEARVRNLLLWFDTGFATTLAWKQCSVVLGMHPDEATEDIVDLSLEHDKPFAVTPCCVFWRRDPQRRTPTGKPVRTWEQFCDYLEAKDPRIRRTVLPFPGRSVVLYSLGGSARL